MDQIRRCFAILDSAGRRRLFWLGVLIFANSMLELASVAMILPFIAVLNEPTLVTTQPVLRTIYTLFGFQSSRAFLIAMGLALLFLILFKNIYFFFVARAQARFCHFQAARSAERLLTGYLSAPYEVHLYRNSASFINTADHAVDQTFAQVMQSFLVLATEGSAVLAILVLLVIVEPLLTFVLVGIVGVSSLGLLLYLRRSLVRLGAAALSFRTGRLQRLQQALSSVKELKVLGRERFFVNEYRKQRSGYAAVQSWADTLSQMPKQVLESVVVGGLIFCIVVILLQGRVAGDLMSVIGLFAMAAFRIMPGVNRVVNTYNTINHHSAYVVETWSDTCNPNFQVPYSSGSEISAKPVFAKDLELRNVSFAYSGAPAPALCNVSLSVSRGDYVGVVGASGAGKSTLIDVILGLLPPQQGQVLVDGVDIGSDPRPWRRLIGYVPQTIALIDDTLRRNVAFGIDPDRIEDTVVWQALKLARLDDFCRSLPNGLDTTLGERGVRLSGGQRQRIGIARALYSEPEILVFDEATSSLDNETEHEITKAIDALHGRKTVLIIAHRLSTVKICDRLVFMQRGRVLDSGSFDEILNRNEEFRSMVRLAELVSPTVEAPAFQ